MNEPIKKVKNYRDINPNGFIHQNHTEPQIGMLLSVYALEMLRFTEINLQKPAIKVQ